MYPAAYPDAYETADPVYPPIAGLERLAGCSPTYLRYELSLFGAEAVLDRLELEARRRGWAAVSRADLLEAVRRQCRARPASWADKHGYADPFSGRQPWEKTP